MGDDIIVGTRVADMKKATLTRVYRIIRPSDGQLLAQARTLWAFVNYATGKPTRIPPEIAGALPGGQVNHRRDAGVGCVKRTTHGTREVRNSQSPQRRRDAEKNVFPLRPALCGDPSLILRPLSLINMVGGQVRDLEPWTVDLYNALFPYTV